MNQSIRVVGRPEESELLLRLLHPVVLLTEWMFGQTTLSTTDRLPAYSLPRIPTSSCSGRRSTRGPRLCVCAYNLLKAAISVLCTCRQAGR